MNIFQGWQWYLTLLCFIGLLMACFGKALISPRATPVTWLMIGWLLGESMQIISYHVGGLDPARVNLTSAILLWRFPMVAALMWFHSRPAPTPTTPEEQR